MQQEVRDAVLGAFPTLEPDDVRSTSMGASGADLLLSPAARKVFPFYVECKNQEALNIWSALRQAETGVYTYSVDAVLDHPILRNVGGVMPLVVFRRNHSPVYAALRFCHLIELVEKGIRWDRAQEAIARYKVTHGNS